MATASHRAYEGIRRLLAEGHYGAGERLREDELSTVLGVSRTPVREALRRLDAEGLVVINEPNKGAYVASWTDEQLQEIFEMRSLLEGYAARRAAVRVTDEDIALLDSVVEQMEWAMVRLRGVEGVDRIAALNQQFHEHILRCSGSALLVATTAGTVHIPLVHRTFARYSPAALRRSFSQHVEIVDACRARDGEWAESVMRSHILAARHVFDKPVREPEKNAVG